jgi:hypothetical protein
MSSSINKLLMLLLTGSAAVSGHMILSSPPALRYKDNPYAGQNIDYDLNSPITSLAEIPCKGSLSLLGTSQATPVATWTAGQTYQMTISGGATHLGGSCQAAVSVDRGKSFHVIKSFIGSCPTPDAKDSSFSFKLPSDTPATDEGIFAWHWSNKVGNREHFSNCAVVKIQGGSGSEGTPFGQRPAPFLANIGNGCATLPGVNVEYPDPGPDVERNGDSAPPTGNCGAAQSYSGSGGGGGKSAGGGGPAAVMLPVLVLASASVAMLTL